MKSDVNCPANPNAEFVAKMMAQCEVLDQQLVDLCRPKNNSQPGGKESMAILSAMARGFSQMVETSCEVGEALPYLRPVCESAANWLHWIVGSQSEASLSWKNLSSIVRCSVDFIWEYSLTLPTNSSRLFLWRRRMTLLVHRISRETSSRSDGNVLSLALVEPHRLPIETDMSFRGLV